MHIVFFMTYGYSLKSWHEAGQLSREMKYFKEYLGNNEDINISLITYGEISDIELFDEFKQISVIPAYSLLKKSNNKYLNFIKSFYLPFLIKRKIKNKKIEYIRQNQLLGSWVSIIFKLITKSKLITRTGYDMYTFSKYEKKSIVKRILLLLLTQITVLFSNLYTVSSKADQKLLKKFAFSKNKIDLVPNWVNSGNYVPIKDRGDKLICVGRLESQKNFKKIINDFSNSKYEIDIFGGGTQKNNLIELSEIKNTKANFLGIRDNNQLLNQYSEYKFYLSSSLFEGNPKTVLEAMSAGCIVIANENKNIKEIIEHGVNGFLLKNKENSYLVLLENIIKNFDLNKISNNAINFVKSNNDLTKIVQHEIKSMQKLK